MEEEPRGEAPGREELEENTSFTSSNVRAAPEQLTKVFGFSGVL